MGCFLHSRLLQQLRLALMHTTDQVQYRWSLYLFRGRACGRFTVIRIQCRHQVSILDVSVKLADLPAVEINPGLCEKQNVRSGEIQVYVRNYISWLGRNAAEVSGLPAATYSLTTSGMSGLVMPEPPSQIADMET